MRKIDWAKVLLWFLIIIITLAGITFIALEIYVAIEYKDTPLGEVPYWAHWLLGGR